MTVQEIKQRFGIIGNSSHLDHAINTARQVAPTDLTVLITGESGTGKEVFPQILHQLSSRKHGSFIAVNCGAIPEGTIDSELFGHEKGAFTGALEARKGYFEVVNGGTIFLDEVAELPLLTQVRLLRVLESGEFMRVGSSKVQKTNVRVVAATNVNLSHAISRGRFREDLFYRLNTVPIHVPALRERKEDIPLLFRKFASDFAERYRMTDVRLLPDALQALVTYRWPGNVRQLKNVTEQLSILEQKKEIDSETLLKYIPAESQSMPVLMSEVAGDKDLNERELLYKVLFEMRKELTDVKKVVFGILSDPDRAEALSHAGDQLIKSGEPTTGISQGNTHITFKPSDTMHTDDITPHQEEEDVLNLTELERLTIEKALKKHNGVRKNAARELGISERTLYRKMVEYKIH
ncbi:MAG: sigma-54 dependent transcriptional regulator [Bacteroidia bacterium]|nr:sigma-54-dependent Fis family transcriptional regulator [Bacteroidia bacterium]MCZ2277366.1 sigma-54 dependent transcriptional regulator [Bacteroidia bacterium]